MTPSGDFISKPAEDEKHLKMQKHPPDLFYEKR